MVRFTKLGIVISIIFTIMGCGVSQPTVTSPNTAIQLEKDKSKETKAPEQSSSAQKVPAPQQTSSFPQSKATISNEDNEKQITDLISTRYNDLWDSLGAEITSLTEEDTLVVRIDVDTDQDAKEWDDQDQDDKRSLVENILNDVFLKDKTHNISVVITYEDKVLLTHFNVHRLTV